MISIILNRTQTPPGEDPLTNHSISINRTQTPPGEDPLTLIKGHLLSTTEPTRTNHSISNNPRNTGDCAKSFQTSLKFSSRKQPTKLTLGNFVYILNKGGDWHLGVASIKQMAATFAAFDHPHTMLTLSLNTLMIYCVCHNMGLQCSNKGLLLRQTLALCGER